MRKELKEIAAKSQELAEEKAEAVQFLTDRTLECLRPQEESFSVEFLPPGQVPTLHVPPTFKGLQKRPESLKSGT